MLSIRLLLKQEAERTGVPPRLVVLTTASLRVALSALAPTMATVLGVPIYTVSVAREQDLHYQGAYRYIRRSMEGNGQGEGTPRALMEPEKAELLAKPDFAQTRVYAGLLQEFERLKDLVEKGTI